MALYFGLTSHDEMQSLNYMYTLRSILWQWAVSANQVGEVGMPKIPFPFQMFALSNKEAYPYLVLTATEIPLTPMGSTIIDLVSNLGCMLNISLAPVSRASHLH